MEKKEKWYFRNSVLIVAILCIGPFALPLLWFNPRFSARTKALITAIVVIASYYLWVASVESIKSLNGYYQELAKSI